MEKVFDPNLSESLVWVFAVSEAWPLPGRSKRLVLALVPTLHSSSSGKELLVSVRGGEWEREKILPLLPVLATDLWPETDPRWGRRVEVLSLDGLNCHFSVGMESLISKTTKISFCTEWPCNLTMWMSDVVFSEQHQKCMALHTFFVGGCPPGWIQMDIEGLIKLTLWFHPLSKVCSMCVSKYLSCLRIWAVYGGGFWG